MSRHLLLLTVVMIPLAACAPLHGKDAHLHDIATPDPPPAPVRAVPQPPPGPLLAHGQFRAWIPREVAPNGDVTDGHWLELSLEPPPVVLEPVQPMPRAPKTHVGRKPRPTADAAPPAQAEAPQSLRVQRVPLTVPTQGGQ